MEVVLHLGAHRTATTTLQKTLGASGGQLAASGIVYWGPKRTRGGLLHGLIGPPGALDPASAAAARRRVAHRLRQARRGGARMVFVSEENALGSTRGAMAGEGFYADAGPRVARLARAFDGHGLTLALAIRSQDAWWPSVRALRILRGLDAATPFPDLCRAAARDWRDVIGDLAASAPAARIAVWSHEAMAVRPEAVFARLTGCNLVSGPGGQRRNAAPRDLVRPLDAGTAARLRRRYAADLAWLRSGADGLADYIDAGPGQAIPAATGQGRRGRPDDGEFQDHGRLA